MKRHGLRLGLPAPRRRNPRILDELVRWAMAPGPRTPMPAELRRATAAYRERWRREQFGTFPPREAP